jgi:nucleotide-binding universal stress UspA family protein
MESNIILIPTDFTSVADCAVNHAAFTVKRMGGELRLLHVVPDQEQIKPAEEKLDQLCKAIETKHGVTAKGVVRVGTIFEDIGKAAEEIKARMILMGTHGVKGFQHVTGSYAIKVITNSDVPFIVVQNKWISPQGYAHIVLPMDLSQDTAKKLQNTIRLAKYFNSKAHIFTSLLSDQLKAEIVNKNLMIVIKELHANNIDYEVKIADGEGSMTSQLLEYASSIKADLIAIVNTHKRGQHEFISGLAERQILTNKDQIPVLVANPGVFFPGTE